MTTTANAVAELLALEDERCRLINERDYAGLAAMLDESLVHVHANGLTQDKAAYLAHLGSRPRKATRKELDIRVHGETAVMTGRQINLPEGQAPAADAPELAVMQVWVHRDGSWKLAAFQATRVAL
jgi:hypothetical protein